MSTMRQTTTATTIAVACTTRCRVASIALPKQRSKMTNRVACPCGPDLRDIGPELIEVGSNLAGRSRADIGRIWFKSEGRHRAKHGPREGLRRVAIRESEEGTTDITEVLAGLRATLVVRPETTQKASKACKCRVSHQGWVPANLVFRRSNPSQAHG